MNVSRQFQALTSTLFRSNTEESVLTVGDAVNEIQVKHAVESSRFTLNVTYALTRETLVLDLNFHYPVVEGVDLAGILKEFSDNVHGGNELAKHIVEKS